MNDKEILEHYEEYKVPPQFVGWIILFLFGLSLMGYGMWSHHLVHDPPRYWDHGSLPDTPAQSMYSTMAPPLPMKPGMIVVNPMPEGRPMESDK